MPARFCCTYLCPGMHPPVPHIIQQQTLWVSQGRGLFWEEEKTLIIADLHLGKSGHFRKEGIAIPQSIYKADLQRLLQQLSHFRAERLVIAGDLSHSAANKELDLFTRWRKDLPGLQVELVKGNHDILQDDWYREAGIRVHDLEYRLGPFRFIHDPGHNRNTDSGAEEPYTFTGHLHPAVQLHGSGRQSLRLPCFYFTERYCILPAFSQFTGTYRVSPQKGESVYAITPAELIRLT